MMEYTFYTDLWSMLQAVAAGLIMGVYYDVFRVLRRFISFCNLSVAIQDILFWITSAVYVFFVCVRLNNGYIRIYFVCFSLLGWAIYYFTFGKLMFLVFDSIAKKVGCIYENIKNRIMKKSVKICTNRSKCRK